MTFRLYKCLHLHSEERHQLTNDNTSRLTTVDTVNTSDIQSQTAAIILHRINHPLMLLAGSHQAMTIHRSLLFSTGLTWTNSRKTGVCQYPHLQCIQGCQFLSKFGRISNRMDHTGLRSGRVQTPDPGGN